MQLLASNPTVFDAVAADTPTPAACAQRDGFLLMADEDGRWLDVRVVLRATYLAVLQLQEQPAKVVSLLRPQRRPPASKNTPQAARLAFNAWLHLPWHHSYPPLQWVDVACRLPVKTIASVSIGTSSSTLVITLTQRRLFLDSVLTQPWFN